MKNIKEKGFEVIAYVGMIMLILWAAWLAIFLIKDVFIYSEEKRAIGECEEWKEEAKIYPGYYLTNWQKEQCDYYNIKIEIK